MRAATLLAAGLLLLSTGAHARFYTVDNVPEKPSGFERAYAASVRLSEMNSAGDHCSAVLVSGDGYLLTNLHCVERCLKDSSFAEKGLKESSGGGYSILTVLNQHPRELTCPNLWWDDAEGAPHGNGTVVWLGKGTETFVDTEVESIPDAVFRDVIAHEDDFAVLKFDLEKPASCIPVAAAPARPGDKVWGIGYPSFTMRYDGFDSTGYKKHVTLGTVPDGLRADPYLSAHIRTERQWSLLSDAYMNDSQLLATVDSMHGSSGSPMIGADGTMVGLLYSNIAPSAERMAKDIGAHSIGMRAAHIVAEVRAGLGDRAAGRIFSCPASAPAASSTRQPRPVAQALTLPQAATMPDFDGSARRP